MATVHSQNPYTGKKLQSYQTLTNKEIQEKIEQADNRFQSWKTTSFKMRSSLMQKVAALLKNKAKDYAKMISLEMGKPISQAISEVEKCAWVCSYYAENAPHHLEPETISTDAYKSYISYEPLGAILAVMPWNYPFWQVFRFAAPALMAGNTVVLKHASNVFGSALLLQEIFEEAGFPKHCFTTLTIGSKQVEQVIAHKNIRAVTLTGSGPAGSAVAATAGKHIKKTVLELGGSNALVVFKDADIEKTVQTCATARFQNTGQSCIAGKRLLLDAAIADTFLEKLVKHVRELKSGDPMDKETYIGTLAREDLAKDLEKQVQESIKEGATVLLGGKRQGSYFEPTILTEVTPEMPAFKEETFGPVLSVTTFQTEEEALALSNSSSFGLGVSLFSSDIKRMQSYISQLEEGAVFINELVKSDPRLPFGGIKSSGYGRELSKEGIREFVNVKTVFISQ